jgi:type III restriction enzyme
MATQIKNKDLVLKVEKTPAVLDILNKYDTYLEALYDDDYSFHRTAVKEAIAFLLSDKYKNQKELARDNYSKNPKLREVHESLEDFEQHLPLPAKKACSLDLATGTGKSYLMYGSAMVMLCEEAVQKVLVLCPSLTIEEGLTAKFNDLNSRKDLLDLLCGINPKFVQPQIKNASETITFYDICIENIHATYERTGSSIEDSFKNKDHDILVLNDEAHHIYSGEVDSNNKKWFGFLSSEDYKFKYIVGVTGTPYYGSENNDYFHDVIYRFSIKDAVDRGIIKKVDPKSFDEFKDDKGFQQTWSFHQHNIEKYGEFVKPITIIVTRDIADCIIRWNDLVLFLMDKESLSRDDAEKKCIWVTSGLPSNKDEKKRIEKIVPKEAEKRRKENLALLKLVDNRSNPVEWIVSVSMLTEGWDVKNVFQIVPDELRAFKSRLLISQVLGRGLRMPVAVKAALGAENVKLLVNNHEAWTDQIMNLYNDILELENRLSWGIDETRSKFQFPLWNFEYKAVETTTETKKQKASEPTKFGFIPQQKLADYNAKFISGNSIKYVFEDRTGYSLEEAAISINSYLKDKDEKISRNYPVRKIKNLIVKELDDNDFDNSYLSSDNFNRAQAAFGPMFREVDKTVARISNKPDALKLLDWKNFHRQSFSEDSLKTNGYIIYTEGSEKNLNGDEKKTFRRFTEIDKHISELSLELSKPGANFTEIGQKIGELGMLKQAISGRIEKVEEPFFNTPQDLVYVSYAPETEFAKTLFLYASLFESFFKNPDVGFYFFPYSYKPDTIGRTHVKHLNFNPDFFLKIKGTDDILVVEIKKADDDNQKNKAKKRDAENHFSLLNTELQNKEEKARYYFKFLSNGGNDISMFFNALKEKKYKYWKSTLMTQLEILE